MYRYEGEFIQWHGYQHHRGNARGPIFAAESDAQTLRDWDWDYNPGYSIPMYDKSNGNVRAKWDTLKGIYNNSTFQVGVVSSVSGVGSSSTGSDSTVTISGTFNNVQPTIGLNFIIKATT